MEKVERFEVGTGRKSRGGCGEVVRASHYDAIAAKLDAVRETLNTPSVMDISFMLDKLREIVK